MEIKLRFKNDNYYKYYYNVQHYSIYENKDVQIVTPHATINVNTLLTPIDFLQVRNDSEILEYDNTAAKSSLFDFATPQECADILGLRVRHNNKIYLPKGSI